jgi:NADH-quinone oxidoreductase subunit M
MGQFGGLLRVVPTLGWFFVLAAFASLGLPGLAHFPAEFEIFLGTLGVYPVAVIVVLGIAVTAGLYLRAIQVAFLGETPEGRQGMKDLGRRELLAVVPLLALTILIGVAPFLVLDVIHAATEALLP